jgi:hypothetical protein
VYLLDSAAITTVFIDSTHFAFVANPGARSNRQIPGGGNRLAVLNGEVRIRDPFFPTLLEWVPFVDAGQVWVSQIEKSNVNRTSLAVTPGISLRYFSPFGPVQANVGYNRYPPMPGPAYFLTAVNQPKRPLICVTSPGDPLLVVTKAQNGDLVQDVAACPSTFVPAIGNGFFRHFTLSFSIATDF